jgi:hypothetical protein
VVPLKIEGRKWRERVSMKQKRYSERKSEGREYGEGKKLLDSKERELHI